MIGMCKQVGGELVVIPNESVADIVLDGVYADSGKVFVEDVSVEGPYSDVQSDGLYGCFPGLLFSWA